MSVGSEVIHGIHDQLGGGSPQKCASQFRNRDHENRPPRYGWKKKTPQEKWDGVISRMIKKANLSCSIVACPLCPPVLCGLNIAVVGHAETGHRAEPVHLLLLLAHSWSGWRMGVGWWAVSWRGTAGLCRVMGGVGRPSCVGCLVDVLAIDIYGVRNEGGASMAVAGVTLLEAEQLELGLDTFEDAWWHVYRDMGLWQRAVAAERRDGSRRAWWRF